MIYMLGGMVEGKRHLWSARTDDGNDTYRLLHSPFLSDIILQKVTEGCRVQVCPASLLSRDSIDGWFDVLSSVGEEKMGDTYSPGWHDVDSMEMYTAGIAMSLGAYKSETPYLNATEDSIENLDRLSYRCPLLDRGLRFAYREGVPVPFLSLILYIWDIRNFIAPNRPYRYSRLKKKLGIDTPGRFIHHGEDDKSQRYLQGWELPKECWSILNPAPGIYLSPLGMYLGQLRMEFLNHYHVRGVHRKAEPLSAWRVTIAFVNFIRLLWSEMIGLLRFDPHQYFSTSYMAESFVGMMKELHGNHGKSP